jgi:hypothetical protein
MLSAGKEMIRHFGFLSISPDGVLVSMNEKNAEHPEAESGG